MVERNDKVRPSGELLTNDSIGARGVSHQIRLLVALLMLLPTRLFGAELSSGMKLEDVESSPHGDIRIEHYFNSDTYGREVWLRLTVDPRIACCYTRTAGLFACFCRQTNAGSLSMISRGVTVASRISSGGPRACATTK